MFKCKIVFFLVQNGFILTQTNLNDIYRKGKYSVMFPVDEQSKMMLLYDNNVICGVELNESNTDIFIRRIEKIINTIDTKNINDVNTYVKDTIVKSNIKYDEENYSVEYSGYLKSKTYNHIAGKYVYFYSIKSKELVYVIEVDTRIISENENTTTLKSALDNVMSICDNKKRISKELIQCGFENKDGLFIYNNTITIKINTKHIVLNIEELDIKNMLIDLNKDTMNKLIECLNNVG